MRNSLIALTATYSFFGGLYGHDVIFDPALRSLTLGGADGTISNIPDFKQPLPDCQVSMTARPQTGAGPDLVSITSAGPNPAATVVLNVHVLRQPQGASESVNVVGTWNSNGMPGPPCPRETPVRFSTTVTVIRTAPVINAIVNGASSLPGVAPGAWITLKGANLTGATRSWNSSDFSGSNLPTQLEGVSVSVNGKNAPFYFISPAQLTILTPGDTPVGPIHVAVTDSEGTTVPMDTTFQSSAPAFFMFTKGFLANQKPVLARHADGCWIAENSALPAPVYPVTPGALDSPNCARPTAPGEMIGLVGTGFGPLGSDAAGNPLTAPTDRDFSDSYWPADTGTDQTISRAPMFPLLDPTAIQLRIGDEILPVFTASRTRPGIDVIWVTIPSNLTATSDSVTWYEIRGSMLGNDLNTVQIPVQAVPAPPA
jgi:uncharacterized protein (TIGR03437 family)